MDFLKNKSFKILFLLIYGVCLLLSYAYYIEPDRLVINHQDLLIEDWKKSGSLRIVAVSDLHAGSHAIDEDKIQEIVETINQQDADLVFLLGDYISETGDDHRQLRMPLETLALNLRGIKARAGVYAVLGNCDGRYDEDRIREALEASQIKVLEDEVATVSVGSHKLRILGLRDHMHIENWEEFNAKTRAIVEDSGSEGDLIVLEHSPDVLPIMAMDKFLRKDVKLFLAGHTHGGQIKIPLFGAPFVPSSYGRKYTGGYLREDGIDMFVTTGIGTSQLPLRFLVPPEIAVLDIEAE